MVLFDLQPCPERTQLEVRLRPPPTDDPSRPPFWCPESSHRHFCNNNKKKHTGNNKQNHNLSKDRAALFNHFLIKHKYITQDKNMDLDITDCYNVIFLQEPTNTYNLDFLESKWISKLKATININKTIIPEIK